MEIRRQQNPTSADSNWQPRNLYPVTISFKHKSDKRHFQTKTERIHHHQILQAEGK